MITSTVSNIVVEILNFNPISFFLNQARAALGVYGELNIASLLIYFIFGLGLFIVSWKFFSKQVKRVAEFF
jgi:ABC-type polysaccharide/polyol phosphate export permease